MKSSPDYQRRFGGIERLYAVGPLSLAAGQTGQFVVTLTNSGHAPVSLEVLDGLPAVAPFGVDDNALKHVGRTIEAWMEVFNLERGVPFYRLAASAADTAEVSAIQAGHFYVAYTEPMGQRNVSKRSDPLPVLVDPQVIFGADTSLYRPLGFINQSLASLVQARQITVGRTPRLATPGRACSASPWTRTAKTPCVAGRVWGKRRFSVR